ncbi:MAG TPA: DUF1289 domain-containing protein [Steroidobacteraceae bacterium]
MSAGSNPPPLAPPSPCINVCVLDEEGYCAGCLRTGAEIGQWLTMSAAERWQLLETLQARRRQRGPARQIR